MRVFTEVGRPRAPALQGVGKAVMAQMPTDEERDILRRTGPKHTENTLRRRRAARAPSADRVNQVPTG
jgi:IclR family acetate operon transcriptional repressor